MTKAAGFYNTLIESDDPALIIENLNGYRLKEKQPSNFGDFKTPIGVVEIIREGILDEKAYKHDEVRRYFRKIANNYRLQTELSVKYLETYSLDTNNWIEYAGQVLHTSIKGLFEYQQIVRITPLNDSI